MSQPRVGIIMGSDSDLEVMSAAAEALAELGVPHEITVVSAHRTPARMMEYARDARGRGLGVIVAGAGGAAHLPGMVAAVTPLPVIGVPVASTLLAGEDSLLSIVQMPAGVPVATVAINGARNAGLLAAQILAVGDAALGVKNTSQWSKDIDNAANNDYTVFFIDGLVGAAMTAAYMTRATYLTFFGEPRGAAAVGQSFSQQGGIISQSRHGRAERLGRTTNCRENALESRARGLPGGTVLGELIIGNLILGNLILDCARIRDGCGERSPALPSAGPRPAPRAADRRTSVRPAALRSARTSEASRSRRSDFSSRMESASISRS